MTQLGDPVIQRGKSTARSQNTIWIKASCAKMKPHTVCTNIKHIYIYTATQQTVCTCKWLRPNMNRSVESLSRNSSVKSRSPSSRWHCTKTWLQRKRKVRSILTALIIFNNDALKTSNPLNYLFTQANLTEVKKLVFKENLAAASR